MTVGSRIKAIRESKGISQVDLANGVKISKQTLYKYENDIVTNIPSDKIENIAKFFNVSPAYIMGWEENTSTHFSQHKNYVALTPHENDVIIAYREKPEMQSAVDTLLGIKENTYKLKIAARGGGVAEEELTESKIEALKNLPDADEF